MHCGIPNAYIVLVVVVVVLVVIPYCSSNYFVVVLVVVVIPYCSSNYFVSIGDPTVHFTTLLIESVLFEGMKMTR